MTVNPRVWYPIAIVSTVLNLASVAFAVGPTEPWWHATSHAVLALAFGLWAQHLRLRLGAGRIGALGQDRLEALETEVNALGRELSEAQERLDFAERMLAQGPEPRPRDAGGRPST